MSVQYTIDSTSLNNDTIAYGSGRVTAKVAGYWSDTITLYVRRGNYGSDEWSVDMSHSSGGRDTKEVESDLVAETNFGTALIAMAQYGEQLKERFEEFEGLYQARREAERKEREAVEAAKAAKVAADKELGLSRASGMIALVAADNEGSDKIRLYDRGSDSAAYIEVKHGAKTTFYFAGRRVSRSEAVDQLARSSNRSAVV